MARNIGVNVVEVDGRASPTIQPAATSVAAFLGITDRGVADRPVRIASYAQFEERFGGFRPDSYLAYAVQGFFLNGGREAYIVRVTGAAARPAVLSVNDRRASGAVPVLQIRAGFRGELDEGAWGERLRIDILDDPVLTTRLTNPVATADRQAVLDSVQGLQVGSVVRLRGSSDVVVKVTRVDAATRTISFADPITLALSAGAAAVSAEFRIVIRYAAQAGAELTVVEQWPGLSMESDTANYAATRINHAISGSRYITVTDLTTGTTDRANRLPAVVRSTALGSSVEDRPAGTDYSGSAAQKTGLFSLDTLQFQLLAIPDIQTRSGSLDDALTAALDYCDRRGDCMFVGSTPDRSSADVARAPQDYQERESDYLNRLQQFAGRFQRAKALGALYSPWIRVSDPIGPDRDATLMVPPEGHVMGIYARTEQERGIHKAPAGLAAVVRGALGVAAEFTDTESTALVRSGLVNAIRPTPGAGIVVTTSRTLSTDTRWWFVNVRLLFNFVKSSLREGLRFVRQEPHTEELRRVVRFNVITPFLLNLWRQGAFGQDPVDQVFTVKCDAENNPPDEVTLGNFRVEVYFYPVKPAETITVIVGQQPGGGSAAEA